MSAVSPVQQTYQQLIEELEKGQLINTGGHHGQFQFMLPNEVGILRILLPEGFSSWQLLKDHRLQYMNGLQFPLESKSSVGSTSMVAVKKLKFANCAKEVKAGFMNLAAHCIKTFVEMVSTMDSQTVSNVLTDDVQRLVQSIQRDLYPPTPAADAPGSFLFNPEMQAALNAAFTEEELSTVWADAEALYESYPNMEANNIFQLFQDVRFKQIMEKVGALWQTKTPEEQEVFMKLMQSSGGAEGGDLSKQFVELADKSLRPAIDDSDPMSLSDEQFRLLCQENNISFAEEALD